MMGKSHRTTRDKYIVFLLIITMIFSMFLSSAFTVAGTPLYYGQIGESVYAELSQDGVLTLSGEGSTYDYSPSRPAPWYRDRERILSVQIENGITSLGSYLFYNCKNLTGKLTLPESLHTIGKRAFSGDSFAAAPKLRAVINEFTETELLTGTAQTPEPSASGSLSPAGPDKEIIPPIQNEDPAPEELDSKLLDPAEPADKDPSVELPEDGSMGDPTPSADDPADSPAGQEPEPEQEDTLSEKVPSDDFSDEEARETVTVQEVQPLFAKYSKEPGKEAPLETAGSLSGDEPTTDDPAEDSFAEEPADEFSGESSREEAPAAEGLSIEDSSEKCEPALITEQIVGTDAFYPRQNGAYYCTDENETFIAAMETAGYLRASSLEPVTYSDSSGNQYTSLGLVTEHGLLLEDFCAPLEAPQGDALQAYSFIGWEAAAAEDQDVAPTPDDVSDGKANNADPTRYPAWSFAPYEEENPCFTACFILGARPLAERTLEKEIDGRRVSVTGKLPENAGLSVEVISLLDAEAIIGGHLADEVQPTIHFAYDLAILVDGEKYQPADYGESVRVRIENAPLPENGGSLSVLHVKDDDTAEQLSVEPITQIAVEFTADSFSPYIAYSLAFTGAEVYYLDGGYYANEEDAKNAANPIGDYATLQDFLNGIHQDVIIHMMSAYSVSGTEQIDGGVDSVTLLRHSPYTGSLITVASGGNLSLQNVTVDGGAKWIGEFNTEILTGRTNSGLSATAPLVRVAGILSLNDGAVLHNNDSNDNGGGIYVTGSLSMSGGAISDNRAYTTTPRKQGGGVYVASTGSFTMTGGEISANHAMDYGGGVYIVSGSSFTMSGGAISGNMAMAEDSGANGYGRGGGVAVSLGSFTMSGDAVIRDNFAHMYGGGIRCDGSFSMLGGTIADNQSPYGGGIYLNGHNTDTDQGNLMEFSGGTITGNIATGSGISGGGIYVGQGSSAQTSNLEGPTLIMSGGVISGNTANRGGGLAFANWVNFEMSGGSVIENASAEGEDIYLNITNTSGGSGTITITGGTAKITTADKNLAPITNAEGDPVYLNTITLEGMVQRTAVTQIASNLSYLYGCDDVSTAAAGDGTQQLYLWAPLKNAASAATVISGVGTADAYYSGAITPQASNSAAATFSVNLIYVNGSAASGGNGTPEAPYNTFAAALAAAETSGSATIVVCGPTELSSEQAIAKNVTLTSMVGDTDYRNGTYSPQTPNAGAVLKRAEGYTGYLITVSGTASLSNITIDGGAVWDNHTNSAVLGRGTTNTGISGAAPMIGVSSGASLSVNSGALLQNNDSSGSSDYGGAIHIVEGNVFMGGGEIFGCNAAHGGAVGGNGTFTMTGGTIHGCAAERNSGAIHVNGSYTISGDAEITANQAQNGGAATVGGNGSLTINGGRISGNLAELGGGIYNSNSPNTTFSMAGGEISGNTATVSGSAVYMITENELVTNTVISGGKLAGSAADGSCITVAGGTFTLGTDTGISAIDIADRIDLAAGQAIHIASGGIAVKSPLLVNPSGSLLPGRVIATYDAPLTADPANFLVSGHTLTANGQNIVLGKLTGMVTAAGEGVALGAGQSKSYTLDLSGLFAVGSELSITSISADASASISGFALKPYGEVLENQRRWGSTSSNTLFGLSAKMSGGTEKDAYADSQSGGSTPLGTAAENSKLTFTVYNGNTITQGGKAGVFVITLSDGTNSCDLELTINRRAGGIISVNVPLQVTGVIDANGQFTFPDTAEYSIQNYSLLPVAVTDIAWTWKTGGGNGVNEMFSDYKKLTGIVNLGGKSYSFTGAAPTTAVPAAGNTIDALNGTLPGKLALGLGINLGQDNYMKSLEAAEVAAITYTIGVTTS